MPCKKTLYTTLLLFLLAGVPSLANAADAELFQASVPVADQSATARAQALRNALEVVLVRVTGNPLVASSPAATSLLDNAAHYAGSYHYEQRIPATVQTQAQTGALTTDPEPVLHLSASFDPAALERAVRQAGLPYWGERPETLVWLAVEEGRQLVGDTNNGIAAQAHDALLQAARARGITLIFPLLDTRDHQRVGYTDVWAGFNDRIWAASERYGTDTVLVGKLYQASNGWQAQWDLLDNAGSTSSQWKSLSGPLVSVMAGGINPLADAYAARYAAHPAQAGAQVDVVELIISGVSSLTAYGAVLDYVQDLTPVHNLQVARVDNNDLRLKLQLNSSVAQLERAISLGRLLTPAPAEPVAWSAPTPTPTPTPTTGTGTETETETETGTESGAPARTNEPESQSSVPPSGASSGLSLAPAMPAPHTVLRYEYHP